jgi:cyanophycin synthetase
MEKNYLIIAHIVKNNGYKVGFTSDGIYIQNHMMEKGDTGPQSAQYILRDPTVEFAVLETARGGFYVLDWALVFVTLVLSNIQEDHLGINDIHTLDDLAK